MATTLSSSSPPHAPRVNHTPGARRKHLEGIVRSPQPSVGVPLRVRRNFNPRLVGYSLFRRFIESFASPLNVLSVTEHAKALEAEWYLEVDHQAAGHMPMVIAATAVWRAFHHAGIDVDLPIIAQRLNTSVAAIRKCGKSMLEANLSCLRDPPPPLIPVASSPLPSLPPPPPPMLPVAPSMPPRILPPLLAIEIPADGDDKSPSVVLSARVTVTFKSTIERHAVGLRPDSFPDGSFPYLCLANSIHDLGHADTITLYLHLGDEHALDSPQCRMWVIAVATSRASDGADRRAYLTGYCSGDQANMRIARFVHHIISIAKDASNAPIHILLHSRASVADQQKLAAFVQGELVKHASGPITMRMRWTTLEKARMAAAHDLECVGHMELLQAASAGRLHRIKRLICQPSCSLGRFTAKLKTTVWSSRIECPPPRDRPAFGLIGPVEVGSFIATAFGYHLWALHHVPV